MLKTAGVLVLFFGGIYAGAYALEKLAQYQANKNNHCDWEKLEELKEELENEHKCCGNCENCNCNKEDNE